MYKTYFNWSSGKDSSLALHKLLIEKEYNISKLVTTINQDFGRVSMHGLRESLLDMQAHSIGLPLYKIQLPAQVSMDLYTETMKKSIMDLKSDGYTHCVFGDIFLEDLRLYRENQLDQVKIKGIFPLWKKNTKALLLEFISLGFKAITVCVNAKVLDKSFCGRVLDHNFINDLPPNVDPCGENGEFHTFVYDGPIYKNPINFKLGEKVLRSYAPSGDSVDNDCFIKSEDNVNNWDTSFWYCDLIPT
ncbi:Dph6-related ATP pyrophosphatase [Aquimarina pacifica]|uniref:Dph6-related ATP pyrophosphatase n=1 Tax=Aquimarina pacifica TaxID=1296415 RepID=UPI00046EB02F|nr:diphthine--ammonia ligase [Aquimarina pacifica]